MATLALAAVFSYVGGAVGVAAGVTWGASAGWLIGSYLGSLMTQTNQVGPRLGEVRVQSSSFGAYLPIVWGMWRTAGQVIALSDLNPIDSSSGGKGGGSSVTTESYYEDYAIAIADARTTGGYTLVRAWENGRLIYNIGPGADAATLSQLPTNLKFYSGSATQMPDPTLEAMYGVGNVSAYRGTCYAVLTQDDVTQTAGRPNQYEFEIASAGSVPDDLTWNSYVQMAAGTASPCGTYLSSWMIATHTNADGVHVFQATEIGTGYAPGAGYYRYVPIKRMEHWIVPASGSPYRVSASGHLPDINIDSYHIGCSAEAASYLPFMSADEPGFGCRVLNPSDGLNWVVWIDGNLNISYLWPDNQYWGNGVPRWMARASGHTWALFWYGTSTFAMFVDGKYFTLPAHGSGSINLVELFVSNSYVWLMNTDPITSDNYLHRFSHAGIWKDTTLWSSGSTLVIPVGVYDDDRIIVEDNVTNLWLWSVTTLSVGSTQWLTGTNNAHGASRALATDLGHPYSRIFALSPYAAVSFQKPDSVQYAVVHRWTRNFVPATITDGDIVADLSQEVDLTSGQYNVTALTDAVAGFAAIQLGSARSLIEQLASGFFFDSADFDGKVNFVKRGGAVVATIPLDNLAAHAPGADPPDPITKVRNDTLPLPTRLDVSYINYARDYQVDTQSSEKLTVTNNNPITMSIPIVITETRAKLIADVNMFEAWTSREVFTFTTGWKWQHLTPTDVIEIEDNGILRIVSKSEGVGGVITWQGVRENPAVYSQFGVGSNSGQTGQYVVADAGPTRLELMDIPPLQLALGDYSVESDDYGYYLAMGGFLDTWISATVVESLDGGTTYTALKSSSTGATMGYGVTALADWTGGNVFDPWSVLRVELDAGDTLSSCTDTQLLQNNNVALYGNEIIQFRDATLVSTGIYDLSGLLHGRLGTEWASVGHVAGERFVLLDPSSVYKITGVAADINMSGLYKPVSVGFPVGSTAAQSFTNTGVYKKPYAPSNVAAYKDTDGSWQLRWTRRSRIDSQWHPYAIPPLGEASEAYAVDIYDSTGTTLKRTYSGLTSPLCHYLLADVTADGAATHFVAKVYQIGALGRGYAGTLTV